MFKIAIDSLTSAYNEREKVRNATLIIEMEGPTTIIRDPDQPDEKKKFTFDYSYWSHDGFIEQDNGYLTKDEADSRYADQVRTIYYATSCVGV